MSPATVDSVFHAIGAACRPAAKSITRVAIVRTREEYVVRAYGVNGRIPSADYFSGGTTREYLADCEATARLMMGEAL